MRAVRDGDIGQLGVLFERYHGPVFDFLSRMTGDRLAAEDMVQDVFMRILKYRGTFRDEGSFETWLFRIARNARADYFRQRPPVEALGDEALERPEPQAGPARRLEADRDRARLRRALMQLREDKRELRSEERRVGKESRSRWSSYRKEQKRPRLRHSKDPTLISGVGD